MGPREVQVKAWMYDYQAATGSLTPVVFLDTDVDGNTDEERQITSFLYDGDHIYRLKQAMVLGIGRVRMLDTLDIPVLKYRMYEGQSSLLALELLRRNGEDTERTRDRCVFTTHTGLRGLLLLPVRHGPRPPRRRVRPIARSRDHRPGRVQPRSRSVSPPT